MHGAPAKGCSKHHLSLRVNTLCRLAVLALQRPICGFKPCDVPECQMLLLRAGGGPPTGCSCSLWFFFSTKKCALGWSAGAAFRARAPQEHHGRAESVGTLLGLPLCCSCWISQSIFMRGPWHVGLHMLQAAEPEPSVAPTTVMRHTHASVTPTGLVKSLTCQFRFHYACETLTCQRLCLPTVMKSVLEIRSGKCIHCNQL